MANRTYRCVHCGEEFTVDDDTQDLIDEGFIMLPPDTCDECYDMIINLDMIDIGSDADPGL
jgi:hypothetical protein